MSSVASPHSVGQLASLDEAELHGLDQLGERVGRLREREHTLASHEGLLTDELAPIRDWVLHAARDENFADELLLGQLALLWFELSDAVENDDQDGFEMAVTMIDEAIRRASRRRQREGFDESPKEAINFVLTALEGASSRELAPVLGVAERTVRGWQRELPERTQIDSERLSTLAQILYDVAPSTTPRGALRWLNRSLHQLGGRTPIEVLNDGTPQAYEALRVLARSGHGQGG